MLLQGIIVTASFELVQFYIVVTRKLLRRNRNSLHTMIRLGIMEFLHIYNNQEYKLADSDHITAEPETTGEVVFADTWDIFFDKFGFKSFDDFFEYSEGKIINKNNKRDVTVLTLGDGPDQKTFFIKRFRDPHYKDMFAVWYKFGRPISQAAVEWNNANVLLSHGIGTYQPVCFGEQKRWGMEKRSFFVTEKLNATEFVEFILERWRQLEQIQRQRIVTAIAKLIRRTHDLNIVLPDLAVWHIFISDDHLYGQCQLSIIDLHRMSQNVQSQTKKIRDLGRFYWSMSDEYFDNELKNLLIDAYMGDNWPGSKASFAQKVKKRVAVIAKRQEIKCYRDFILRVQRSIKSDKGPS